MLHISSYICTTLLQMLCAGSMVSRQTKHRFRGKYTAFLTYLEIMTRYRACTFYGDCEK
ncbi:hypothetical protein APHDU1_0902 [Anaplasma phagocytophilum]|nr:hypothetical protein APHNYW_1639 [Anaplasma phagocytophilum str. ApNYW]KJV88146.1 hypothetical protein APHNYW_0101 [Anaplasma phagocytophilum str. ApNYW]KKA00147.1 hypothetical protein APHDU1_0902 [Anaplasma phagocytophilum]